MKRRWMIAGSIVTIMSTIGANSTFAASSQSFVDVKQTDWFSANVTHLNGSGLVQGEDSTHFSPDANITRAEFAKLLYNIAGKPTVTTDAGFVDVLSSDWFANAVNYAKQAGLVYGEDATHFAPNDNITRQEAAKMLWNMVDTTKADKQLFPQPLTAVGSSVPFKDDLNIAGWGFTPIYSLSHAGVINGYTDGTFQPGHSITRAESVKMLDLALQKVGYKFGQAPTGGSSSVNEGLGLGNPTSNNTNITDNSDGTKSFGNITTDNNKILNTNTVKSALSLMEQVKFTANGSTITVTVPATNDKDTVWAIEGSDNQVFNSFSDSRTMTFNLSGSKQWVDVALVQNSTGYGYSDALIFNDNGQWTVKYN